mmetsp:Transcript_18712/g.71166  ORF Transcript_18712/g.71166 Transcript_18712/m.71166 type:complete len:225 (+) Transcript_18712:2276-2950(+)
MPQARPRTASPASSAWPCQLAPPAVAGQRPTRRTTWFLRPALSATAPAMPTWQCWHPAATLSAPRTGSRPRCCPCPQPRAPTTPTWGSGSSAWSSASPCTADPSPRRPAAAAPRFPSGPRDRRTPKLRRPACEWLPRSGSRAASRLWRFRLGPSLRPSPASSSRCLPAPSLTAPGTRRPPLSPLRRTARLPQAATPCGPSSPFPTACPRWRSPPRRPWGPRPRR